MLLETLQLDGNWRCDVVPVRADGVSAGERIRLICEREVVAETAVAAHGHFVVAAILPRDAQVAVEAG